MTLRERIAEVEEDTQEVYLRRELVKLLVERISVDSDEDGRAEVGVTYRFGPPAGEDVLVGVRSPVEPHTEENRVWQIRWKQGWCRR